LRRGRAKPSVEAVDVAAMLRTQDLGVRGEERYRDLVKRRVLDGERAERERQLTIDIGLKIWEETLLRCRETLIDRLWRALRSRINCSSP